MFWTTGFKRNVFFWSYGNKQKLLLDTRLFFFYWNERIWTLNRIFLEHFNEQAFMSKKKRGSNFRQFFGKFILSFFGRFNLRMFLIFNTKILKKIVSFSFFLAKKFAFGFLSHLFRAASNLFFYGRVSPLFLGGRGTFSWRAR